MIRRTHALMSFHRIGTGGTAQGVPREPEVLGTRARHRRAF